MNDKFWTEKLDIKDEPDAARIDGEHYMIAPESWKSKGFGGAEHRIRFDDGRVVTTTNLWHQGTIPEDMREQLPNNAHWVRRIKVEYV